MKFTALIILLFLIHDPGLLSAQSKARTSLSFQPTVGNSKLYPGDTYYKLSNGDSIEIETLKFYISNIEVLNKERSVWKEKNSFHLVDASVAGSTNILMNIPSTISFDQIKFDLGIDSVTNVSGAMGGDLDPTRGMYWTWQSGYINFKLEGKSKHCKTRNNEFQFHLGGYQPPFSALQSVILNTELNEPLVVVLDLNKLIGKLDLSAQNHIMSPCTEAVLLSKKVADSFSIQKK